MAAAKDLKFTEKDMTNLALAWQCFESEPTINYKKFAEIAGYTEGSAKTIFGTLRRKVKACASGEGTGATNGDSALPTTPKKRKNVNGDANGTPAKKRSPAKKKTAALTPNGSDDDETFSAKYAVKNEAAMLNASTNEYLGIKPEYDENEEA